MAVTGPVIDVEYKEILPDGSTYSYAYDFNKFACDVISKINERYRTSFSCVMGMDRSFQNTSSMDKSGKISIVIGLGNLPDEHNKNRIEAMKLAIAHEIAHHVYQGMTLSAIAKLALTADKVANSYRKVIMACSIEVAADLHAKRLYTEQGKIITAAIYEEYIGILTHGKEENEEMVAYFINKGTLPPSFRIKYLKKYKRFEADDYEVLSEIISDLSRLTIRFMNKRLGLRTYEKWIKAQMELSNFPNRVNRLRR